MELQLTSCDAAPDAAMQCGFDFPVSLTEEYRPRTLDQRDAVLYRPAWGQLAEVDARNRANAERRNFRKLATEHRARIPVLARY